MTKEQAIQILSTRDAHGVICGYTSGVTEALNMAIQALEQETVSKETYDHEFNLRKELEMKVFELEQKIAEQEDRPKGKWIPCSERLPNTGSVLITDGSQIVIGEYHGNNVWSVDGCDYKPILDGIAWMPLPTPYKDGERSEE